MKKKKKHMQVVTPKCVDCVRRIYDLRLGCYKCKLKDVPGIKFVMENGKRYPYCCDFYKK